MFAGAGKDRLQKGRESRPARQIHKTSQRLVDQSGALDTKQGGAGQIDFQNQPFLIDGEVADGREIIEVEIGFQQRFHLVARRLQLGILQFEFELMNLQLMEKPMGIGLRAWQHRGPAQTLELELGRATQLGWGALMAGFLRHERILAWFTE